MRKVVSRWLSALSGERLERTPDAPTVEDSNGVENRLVNVYRDARHQRFEGFGAALTESAAVALAALPEGRLEEAMAACYSPTAGNAYAFCRLPMGSCDFSLGNYAHSADPDAELADFSVARDLKGVIPLAKAASRARGKPVAAIVSPWSPPGWMKDSGAMNGGGRLLPRWRKAWASCFVRYIQALEDEGIPVWGLTVQNEPKAVQTWDSCVWTAEEERDFVRDHLGPALDAAGLSRVRILVWDHNKERVLERSAVILADPSAARHVAGIAFHWYSGDHFEALDIVSRRNPELALVASEACQEGGVRPGSWDVAERYAHAIMGDLNHGATAWLDWNMALDAAGGPNHAGNFCDAPIIADAGKGELFFEPSYHAIAHFSRFIHPGARRVAVSRYTDRLEVTCFENPDGGSAAVVLNRGAEELPFILREGNRLASTLAPPRSIQTLVF